MKLWQKNYLFTALLFTAVLFVCVGILIVPVVRMTLTGARDAALSEEKAIANVLEGQGIPQDSTIFATMAQYYAQNDTYLRAERDGTVLANRMPFAMSVAPGSLEWQYETGKWYVAIGDRLSDGTEVLYLHEVSARVRAAISQGVSAIGLCLLLTVLVNIALYYTMLQINKPLSRLSHELRTPLTVIRGYGEMLQLAAMTEEQRHDAAAYIVSECDRLKDIVQKLLTINDRTKAERERIPLRELSDRLGMTWSGIEVICSGEAIWGDRTLLVSLLDNLIRNAQKAAPDGHITVRLSEQSIEVQDDGCGMDLETLAYVNDPAHIDQPREIKSGLGVPLCHEIARLHRAKLHYDSEPGKGTTATVLFYNSDTTL